MMFSRRLFLGRLVASTVGLLSLSGLSLAASIKRARPTMKAPGLYPKELGIFRKSIPYAHRFDGKDTIGFIGIGFPSDYSLPKNFDLSCPFVGRHTRTGEMYRITPVICDWMEPHRKEEGPGFIWEARIEKI